MLSVSTNNNCIKVSCSCLNKMNYFSNKCSKPLKSIFNIKHNNSCTIIQIKCLCEITIVLINMIATFLLNLKL